MERHEKDYKIGCYSHSEYTQYQSITCVSNDIPITLPYPWSTALQEPHYKWYKPEIQVSYVGHHKCCRNKYGPNCAHNHFLRARLGCSNKHTVHYSKQFHVTSERTADLLFFWETNIGMYFLVKLKNINVSNNALS